MTTRQSTTPIMVTHWDPDLYPAKPAPGIQELVVYMLGGNVLLKEVDLLLNPKIRAAFRDPAVVRQFASLLDTGRLKVLLPPRSTDFCGIDPDEQPMTAVAHERDRKRRPLKSRVRKLTPADERYCAELDRILVNARTNGKPEPAIQFRKDFPAQNDFATTFSAVLSNSDRGWRRRLQFRAIDDEMARDFRIYCEKPSEAVAQLSKHSVVANAQEFYRSLGYQLADLYCSRQRRAMKNLLQSVYADRELNREGARGTYWGTRLAELPPVGGASAQDLLSLEFSSVAKDPVAEIPVADNIGEIVERVLEECGPESAKLADVNASHATVADRWAHTADAFAKYSVGVRPVRWSPRTEHWWHVTSHRIRFGTWLLGTTVVGAQLTSTFGHPPLLEYAVPAIHGLSYCAKPVVEWIRRGRAYDDRDAERARVRRILLDAIAVRIAALD